MNTQLADIPDAASNTSDLSPKQSLILGTAGHIDHGKSSLVHALTGVNPDRLKEEKRRGITIELGFAQLDLGEGTRMGVVDVPGHERFVRQMIAGSTGIDVALFCIAADDGIMPQTIEHKAVLELLAIPHCLIALTKCDLVDKEWIEFMSAEIHTFFAGSSFENAEIIPVSSHTGEGLDKLKHSLQQIAQNPRQSKEKSTTRFPVDRVFTIKGSGTVATGTLWSGSLSPEDEIEIIPQGLKARVKSVQVHGEVVEQALAGNRVAVNLNAIKKSELSPGDFIITPGSLVSSDRFDAYFTYLDTTKSGKPLKSGSRIHLAHGTREVTGRILFMNGKELLKSGDSAFVQLRLDEALPLSWRDRFIVRSYSPVHVIGGGKVLLNRPRHRTLPNQKEIELLEALNREDCGDICRLTFALQNTPMPIKEIASFCGMDLSPIKQHLQALENEGFIVSIGEKKHGYYATKAIRQKYLAAIENQLLRFHAENPQQTGITKAAFMQQCDYRGDLLSFDALLDDAAKEGKAVLFKGEVSHPQAGSGAKMLEDQTAEILFGILSKAAAKPPLIPELINHVEVDPSVAYRALGLLEEQNRIKRINNELCFTAEAFNTLEDALRNHFALHTQATASELKDAMDSSRKYTIPLLEYFDEHGVTTREGDARRLR